jgi:UDP:flavonoid glycosyltransferase YjiC (YdhE family)
MSRFLILSWDGGGNTPSAYHLGSRLIRRGHHVKMMGWQAMATQAAAAGLEFTTYHSIPPWPADLRHEDGWERVAAALTGASTEADIAHELGTFRPDVLIVDCMLTAGYAAAPRLDLPVASLVHPLYQPFVHDWGSSVLGTDVEKMLDMSGCVLALQPPGFDHPAELPVGTAYVGAILSPADPPGLVEQDLGVLAEPGDPWILMSLSTTLQGQREALPGLLSPLARMPVRVLLTLGGVLPSESVAAPANVQVRQEVPHASVMPYVDALVTHAGMSTVATALAFGVPMVCVPQGREQPLNANRVVEVGSGVQVDADAVPFALGEAVNTVLTEPRYRAAAQGFATSAARLGYGEYATNLVENLVTRPL